MSRGMRYRSLKSVLAQAGSATMPTHHRQLGTPHRDPNIGAGKAANGAPDVRACTRPMDAEACASCAQYPCQAVEALLTGRRGMLAWLVLCLSE